MFKLVVLSVALAVAAAKPSVIAPLWGGHLAAPWAAAVAAPLAAVAPIGAHNYRGPLSLAPGQPANILAADGRPLDTLDVNVDRAVHYTAKALDHGHWLKKRSVVGAPWGLAHGIHAAPIIAPAPIVAAAPLGHWGLGHAAVGHWGHHW